MVRPTIRANRAGLIISSTAVGANNVVVVGCHAYHVATGRPNALPFVCNVYWGWVPLSVCQNVPLVAKIVSPPPRYFPFRTTPKAPSHADIDSACRCNVGGSTVSLTQTPCIHIDYSTPLCLPLKLYPRR